MKAVIYGPDRGIESALLAEGVEVVRLDGVPSGPALDEAGLADADLFVLTDVAEATAVPVARERNHAIRVVVYSPDAIPEFVRGQVDLAISPAALSADVVAEELVGNG